MRQFEGGATRDDEAGKLDYEGFLSPLVLRAYAEYMHRHRETSAGCRPSDNWQKGIPRDAYMKSAWRHFMSWWSLHRGATIGTNEGLEDALSALIFNAMGYLHEVEVGRRETQTPADCAHDQYARVYPSGDLRCERCGAFLLGTNDPVRRDPVRPGR